MMQDTINLHGFLAGLINYPMSFAHKTTKAASPNGLRLTASRMRRKALKRTIKFILISICRRSAELRFTVIANFRQISVGRSAQYDLSHVVRVVRLRSP